ncbi:dockerin type I repeat-containing protein [bacterium]|nr:dockerin type I repeat-containing protein [bacterium]
MTGSGTLFELEFSVIGSNGTSGALTLSQVTLNDGGIETTVGNGSFTVDSVYDVRGKVRFWNENRPVSGVALRLEGEQNFQGESTSDGSYGINGAIAGSYELKPAKSNETSSISPYDAALVLQHAVGLTTLNGASLTAADVNKNGTVNSTDAYHILQYSVGLTQLPFSGSGVVWDFEPQTRSVQVQQSHLTNIDFTGILIGDVSGNWPDQPASQTLSLSEAHTAIASLVQVDMVARAPGLLGVMSRELNQPRLSNAPTKLAWRSIDGASENQKAFMLFAQTSAPGLVSVDAAITYPGLHTIQAGSLSDSMFLAQGNPSDDQARIGMATAAPVHGTGSLITLQSDQASLAFPTLEHIAINEGHHAVMWDQEGQWMEEDADADGHSFWQEIVAGTDPEDVHSVFQIQGSRWTDQGALEITWTSVPDKRYLIERRSMEDASAWTPVQNPTQAKHPTTAVKVSAPQLGEIYRVRVLP